MGWTGQKGQTRAQLVRELTLWTGGGRCLIFLDTPEGLWAVWQFVGGEDDGKKLITLNLIESRNGYLMCKPMDETMGPHYYSCPLAFLDIATDFADLPWSFQWRYSVRAHWAAKSGGE